MHWIATHPEEDASDIDSIIRGVHAWNDRKARVMKSEHMKIAWHRLVSQKWITITQQALASGVGSVMLGRCTTISNSEKTNRLGRA